MNFGNTVSRFLTLLMRLTKKGNCVKKNAELIFSDKTRNKHIMRSMSFVC